MSESGDPIDGSPPGSPVPGILQAKTLERVFSSLGRFIPRYFILLDVMVNEIVSLIILSDMSLLVYRNATDLCTSIN